MDKTETYIKMCDCEEIQGLKPMVCYDYHDQLAMPNWFYGKAKVQGGEVTLDADARISVWCEDSWYSVEPCDDYIWLPRQEQLQEMVADIKPNTTMPRRLLHRLADWYDNYPEAFWFASMEQLWLAFVMSEKYGKIWTNGEWI